MANVALVQHVWNCQERSQRSSLPPVPSHIRLKTRSDVHLSRRENVLANGQTPPIETLAEELRSFPWTTAHPATRHRCNPPPANKNSQPQNLSTRQIHPNVQSLWPPLRCTCVVARAGSTICCTPDARDSRKGQLGSTCRTRTTSSKDPDKTETFFCHISGDKEFIQIRQRETGQHRVPLGKQSSGKSTFHSSPCNSFAKLTTKYSMCEPTPLNSW